MENASKALLMAAGVLIGILIGSLVSSYNKIVSLQENVDSKFSDIDVQLERRLSLIPF